MPSWALGHGGEQDRNALCLGDPCRCGLRPDRNLKAEAAYRYLHIGDVNTARIVCTVPCAPFNARIKGLDSHDLKVGLRYVFADSPVAYAPGPLMRKY